MYCLYLNFIVSLVTVLNTCTPICDLHLSIYLYFSTDGYPNQNADNADNCLAMKKTVDGNIKLLTRNCNEEYPALCEINDGLLIYPVIMDFFFLYHSTKFTNTVFKIIEKFEDIKSKWQKDKTMVDQTLHRKLKIEYTESH